MVEHVDPTKGALMIRLVGLDISLTAPGVCVNDRSPVVLSPPPTMRGGQRLAWIGRTIERTVANEFLSLAVMETPAYDTRQPKTLADLAEVNGVVKAFLAEAECSVLDVSPGQLKKFATGSGATRGENKVTKAKVKAACVETWGIPRRGWDDNQIDAFVMARVGEAYLAVRLNGSAHLRCLPQHQQEVIAKLLEKELT